MRWTIGEVAHALGVATPTGLDPLARLAGVSIDSRTLGPGELFVAIHGPRHDGHSFVGTALAAGAPAAVVARTRLGEFPAEVRGKLLAVGEPQQALHNLALAVRREWGGCLAGVTGSVGKTTTKEILAALLAARFRVLKSEGNLNNEYGLPLTLLRLDPQHEAVVVEMGMSHVGEIRRLAEIAEPDVGVVTSVAPVHLEFFASVEEIAATKRELIEGLRGAQSVAVLNADDERVAAFAGSAPGRVLRYGFAPEAEFRAEALEDRGAEGSGFDFIAPTGRARLKLPLVGRHNVSNALGALAAASVWGVGAAEAAEVFPRLRPASMRGEMLHFADGFAVINDCYNSNPVALAAMVALLAKTPGYRRRILVAGEMLELGPTSAELHREAGRKAAALGALDWIIAVQGQASALLEGARAAGHPETRVKFFASSEEAGAFVQDLVAPGDLLLVKGSRGVRMERIVEALKSRHALAEHAAARGRA